MAELPMKRSCLTFKALRIPYGTPDLPVAIPHDLIEVPPGSCTDFGSSVTHSRFILVCVSVCSLHLYDLGFLRL